MSLLSTLNAERAGARFRIGLSLVMVTGMVPSPESWFSGHRSPPGGTKILADFVRMLNNLDARLADIAACNDA